MRVCLIYDCLYPWTVGGAERWLRSLAEALAAEGHEVTYLTRLQWDRSAPPEIPGVRVVAVSGADALYGPDGNRLIGPPLRFGRGVLGHLLRHGDDYDVVHTCAFPYFSLLAAGAAGSRPLFVDWFEVWSREYWRDYLGGPRGWVGWAVQRACARVPQQAFTFSELHAERLREEGLSRGAIRLGGLYAGPTVLSEVTLERDPLVVFAGRHIPDKRVTAIPAAVALAREEVPGLRALVLGDGPEREALLTEIAERGLEDCIEAPGFVEASAVEAAIRSAACLLFPSQREGYGLVVIEAAAQGHAVRGRRRARQRSRRADRTRRQRRGGRVRRRRRSRSGDRHGGDGGSGTSRADGRVVRGERRGARGGPLGRTGPGRLRGRHQRVGVLVRTVDLRVPGAADVGEEGLVEAGGPGEHQHRLREERVLVGSAPPEALGPAAGVGHRPWRDDRHVHGDNLTAEAGARPPP